MAKSERDQVYNRWYSRLVLNAHFSSMPAQASEMIRVIMKQAGECYRREVVSTSFRMQSDEMRSFDKPITEQLKLWPNMFPRSGLKSASLSGELDLSLSDTTWHAALAPEHSHDKGYELELELPLAPIRAGGLANLADLIQSLMSMFAAERTCHAAYADVDSHFEIKEQMALAWREMLPEESRAYNLWRGSGAARREHIRSVSWLTLLTPAHLAKLGGVAQLQAATTPWKAVGSVPEVRAIGKSHAMVCLSAVSAAGISPLMAPPTHFAQRVADAGLCWESILRERRMLLGPDSRQTARDLAKWRAQDVVNVRQAASLSNGDRKSASEKARSRAYYRNHPPAFLRNRCVIGSKVDFPQSYVSPHLVVHRIAMPGHSHVHTAWGAPSEYDYLFRGPLYIGGKTQAEAFVVIDPSIIGHDGVQRRSTRTARRKLRQLRCPQCWHDQFRFAIALEYSLKEHEIAEIGLPAEELFTWMYVHAACAKCKWRKNVLDVECA